LLDIILYLLDIIYKYVWLDGLFLKEICQMAKWVATALGAPWRLKRTRGRGALSGCLRGHPNGPKRTAQRVRLGRRVGDALTML
jgi:hypothetical protein